MKHNSKHNLYYFITIAVLIAALALTMFGCGNASPAEKPTVPAKTGTNFTIEVTDLDGNITVQELTSDKKTVGEALQEMGILEGEEGPYGLYIKAVNGLELDWDRDAKYWAFYVDGEYALAGADQTDITEGSVYSFKPEG